MNELRTLLQTQLSSLTSVECGIAKPDNLVEEGITYFSYELEERTVDRAFDRNAKIQVILTGRIVRKVNKDENTPFIVDEAMESIKAILKATNFEYSFRDVSQFTDGYRKIAVDGTAYYYEKNNALI